MSFEVFKRIVLRLCSKANIKNPKFEQEESRQGLRFVAYVGDKIMTSCPGTFGITVKWRSHMAMMPKEIITEELEACSA